MDTFSSTAITGLSDWIRRICGKPKNRDEPFAGRESMHPIVPSGSRLTATARLLGIAFCVGTLAALVLAVPAQASYHHIMVREVYPGGAANNSYVELQTYDPLEDQYFLGDHAVKIYAANGTQ